MLEARNLTCRRGGRTIFRDLQFTINPGDALVVTGANGSGKSSLLRVLAGLLPVQEGVISWQGRNAADDAAAYRRQLHYIGHLDTVKPELTVAETLDYWRALLGLPAATAHAAEDPFQLLRLLNKPVRYLSAGQKRRLALSRLLMNDAALWLLDEPTTALDHEGQNILLHIVAKHRASGGIAVIATHHDLALPEATSYSMKDG